MIHPLHPAMAALLPNVARPATSVTEMRAQSAADKAPHNARAAEGLSLTPSTVRAAESMRPMLLVGPRTARAPVVHIHGGGWSIGTPEGHLSLLAGLHKATGRQVIAPHPRQAPEHPHPTPLDDVVAMLQALCADLGSIHLSGDSAGAHLALHAASTPPGRGLPILSLALCYGCYRRHFETPSHGSYGNGSAGLSTDRMRRFWDWYDPDGTTDLSGANVEGLPPLQLHAPACDILRDDTLWLAAHLDAAGPPVELHTWPGMAHGFLHYPHVLDSARRAFQNVAGFMAEHDPS